MSIKILSQVWEHGPEDKTELLVMLALADFCNDQGTCWPSMDKIAEKARLSDARSARRIVRRLQDNGWLEVDTGNGRHGCNNYRIKPGPSVPRTESPPDPERKKPGPSLQKTRTPEPPEPSGTVKEPSLIGQADPDPDFDTFWMEWPLRRVKKQNAKTAFNRLSKQNRQQAIDCVKDWAKNWRAAYPQASDIHPTSYLNGRRWQDEFQQTTPDQSAKVDRWRKLAGG